MALRLNPKGSGPTVIRPQDQGTVVISPVNEDVVVVKQGTGPPGPAGPAGPQGPAGADADAGFRFIQVSPSAQWVISHPLSFLPNVTVVDSTGREVIPGDVVYGSGTVTLTFSAAFGGEAYLS